MLKTKLPDGRTFQTLDFLSIEYDSSQRVYKYTFLTEDRKVKSSPGHKWMVWDTEKKDVDLIPTSNIDKDKHKLIVMDVD